MREGGKPLPLAFQKNTSVGSEHQLNTTLVFFLNEFFFEFQKKLQVLDQVHFKKITTIGSSHFLSPNG